MYQKRLLLAFVLLAGCMYCAAARLPAAPLSLLAPRDTLAEYPIQRLAIQGPLSRSGAEISGLAWHGDQLVILPQNPHRLAGEGERVLFLLSKKEILDVLDGRSKGPLKPRALPLVAPHLDEHVPSFQGFEALTFHDDRVFFTIESAAPAGQGYLLSGRAADDLSQVRLYPERAVRIPSQAHLANISYEALLFVRDTLVALYELNGAKVNSPPFAYLFDTQLRSLGRHPFPFIEYRITDATDPDRAGRFWVMNYFFPGERQKVKPAVDSLTLTFKSGATHRRYSVVERLVELQYRPEGIVRTETPPLLLELREGQARNWEGLVRLDNRGFLIATDEYPETILAFLPYAF